MRASHRDFDGQGAWIDFNSLDVKDCWTSGGPNATCPYSDSLAQQDDLKKKFVLVRDPISQAMVRTTLMGDRSLLLQLLLY